MDLFHADTQTNVRTDREKDMTKLTVAFRNSANAPKNLRITRNNAQRERTTTQSSYAPETKTVLKY